MLNSWPSTACLIWSFSEGDLEVDCHHTVEDISDLGAAVLEALGDKQGIVVR